MNTKVYNSLKEFFNRDKYTEGLGDIVSTLGFDKENDGGAANYIVESTAYTNDDQIVFLNDTVSCKGFKLRLLPENGVVYVEQFGAKGNYDLSKVSEADKAVFYENNSNAIQNAFNSGLPSIAFANKVYMVSGDILISKPVRVIGNSAKLKLAQNNDSIITIGCQDTILENVEISDLILEGVSSSENCTLVSAENVGDFTLDRISFDTANRALSVTSVSENSYEINVRNCTAINVASGFKLDNVIDFKITNCRIELANTEDSKGLYFTQKTSFGVVEDVSVYNAEYG